eukprot:TRINITY_DN18186_c0_g1_i1.p1 TRINITY_DN18186_c0_g1~~TRINITY_DN18186_c0_g1_i1.p1  ORF type:complete len:652 (-),score=192.09 TRINITY_DN18186_c0_g1_i1:19-1974(-)
MVLAWAAAAGATPSKTPLGMRRLFLHVACLQCLLATDSQLPVAGGGEVHMRRSSAVHVHHSQQHLVRREKQHQQSAAEEDAGSAKTGDVRRHAAASGVVSSHHRGGSSSRSFREVPSHFSCIKECPVVQKSVAKTGRPPCAEFNKCDFSGCSTKQEQLLKQAIKDGCNWATLQEVSGKPDDEAEADVEKAVRLCDWGPVQGGSYEYSVKSLVENLQATSAVLCKEACCADAGCSAFVYNKAEESCVLLNDKIDLGTFKADETFVSGVRAATVEKSKTGKEENIVQVTIGGSDLVQKCVKAPTKVVCEEDAASSEKRVNKDQDEVAALQTFAVTVSNGRQVCAQRTDAKEGWRQNLAISCKEADLILAGGEAGAGEEGGADTGGGTRFFALRVDAGEQEAITICEVKLFNEEMENVASKTAVQILEPLVDSHVNVPEHKTAQLLVDHQFFVPGESDQADVCLTWSKLSATKLLARFEFSSKMTISAARIYSTHRTMFGPRMELLASQHDPGSEWKAVLSTVPTQGLTVQFDGDLTDQLMPPGGNPACPQCMQDEGFPPEPAAPPVKMNKTKLKFTGPPGAPGEVGAPGITPKRKKAGTPPMRLIIASFIVNLAITGGCFWHFRKKVREKYEWTDEAWGEEEWKRNSATAAAK